MDFCRRAGRRGLINYFLPQASAVHHNPHAVRQDHDPELKRIIQDSRALYFKKHRPVWETWALSLLHRFEKVA